MSPGQPPALDSSKETHLLYVLLDSNLPTGGFVSSSGLESYAKHGLISGHVGYIASEANDGERPKANVLSHVIDYVRAEMHNYSSTTTCFVRDAWRATDQHLASMRTTHHPSQTLDSVVQVLSRLDELHEAALLSHIARRASQAQGAAMLTLYQRGLSRPLGVDLHEAAAQIEDSGWDLRAEQIISAYKRHVRKGDAPGHLAVAWGLVTAFLGLRLDRAIHLYLFLHARSVLSAAVRLNLIGPYASSQLLLHPCEDIIAEEMARTGSQASDAALQLAIGTGEELSRLQTDPGWWVEEAESGPCTTWPLGEILMSRHDMQHSRIFNS